MENLEYKQMREREQAVIDRLSRKLKNAPNLGKLSGRLKIVLNKLDKDGLLVMRDIVDEAIKFIEDAESNSIEKQM